MAYLILPSRRTRQPSGAVGLNPSHHGFESCLVAYSGNVLTGPVLGRAAVTATVAGNATRGYHPYGSGVSLDGAGDWVSLGSSVILSSEAQPFTLAWEETAVGSVASYELVCSIQTPEINNLTVFHALAADGSYGRLSAGKSGGVTARRFATAPAQELGVSNRWLLVARGGAVSTTNSDWTLYVDGVEYAASNGATTTATTAVSRIGAGSAGTSTFKGVISNFTLWGSAFSVDEAADFYCYPYGHYAAIPRRIWFDAGAGGGAVTGTLSGTDGADAAAFSGSHTAPSVTGALAATDGADSAAFSGSHTQNVTGTLAATDGADLGAFAGAETFTGTLAATEGADSAAFSGSSVNGVAGTLAATDGADLAAFAGTQTVVATGTLAATDGADSAAFVGIFLQNITGTLAAVDGADSAEFSGAAAGTVTGTLAATDGADSAYFYYLATDAPDVSKLIDRDTLRLGSMPPVKRRGVTTYGTGRISKPRLG